MKSSIFTLLLTFLNFFASLNAYYVEGLPLYYWQKKGGENFGDHLSLKLVERIIGGQVLMAEQADWSQQKLLAVGSILVFANEGDVVWGTGMNAKRLDLAFYKFNNLDVRAVRGPLTRDFLTKNFNIHCPEIYGDPVLLLPYFFPEFKKKAHPKYEYVIVPHYSEEVLFPKELYPHVVYPTDPWNEVVKKILDSKFVISSSLHGLIVAEAYGIPARLLRISEHEPLFKYEDYYLGTGRSHYAYARSIEEALEMGGEPVFKCDLKKLYDSFPFEYWPHANFKHPTF